MADDLVQFYINTNTVYHPFLQQSSPLQSHSNYHTPSHNMPSTVTRTATNMLLSCIRSHRKISSDSTSYKHHSNKKGVQTIEKAEMLDLEDCAWM
ncbi:hypothetical protein M422DRAFT_276456 [Sphaerobolus stellatus SS14]|uniref:Uncharacterized protein n=1 Tax=Sphaerobolus stellatus (strain SS14) TaxID=990650 RepID=A0A0C9U1X8_SPHS4|nr:hypothetical protein M422DRAFT_276456 [Sphaerobolus stellatus SS14]